MQFTACHIDAPQRTPRPRDSPMAAEATHRAALSRVHCVDTATVSQSAVRKKHLVGSPS
jgi:hypothetical protein